MHLRMALSSIEGDDADCVVHHMEHYRELVEGPSALAADEAIALVQAGDLHDAEHEIKTLMEGVHEEEEHHHGDEHEE